VRTSSSQNGSPANERSAIVKSKLWEEFKSFAFKGNMIDLAIAVVIGAAFSGVINSLVQDIIMPSITYVTTTAQEAVTTAKDVAEKTAADVGVTTQPASTQPGAAAAAAAAAPPPPPPPPPAAAPPGGSDKAVEISWTIGRIRIGNFIAQLINFMLVAFAVFILMVKLVGSVMKQVGGTPEPSEPTTKECPFCLSVIPIKARKCSQCTADLPQA
jgi:large conductance mechanosensitive channel